MVSIEPRYKEYFCSRNAPLNCDQLQKTMQEFPEAKFCLECGFPALLPQKTEIKGSRGTYQITGLFGSRGMGRLYLGRQMADSQPVVIKEYLLPSRSFNADEARQRQDTFLRVAGVSPADGRNQDFRLFSPWEVIADLQQKRCYTVSQGNLETSQTLSQYLIEKGAMRASQVREVLNQALQTLQFLHTQKLRFPSGQVQQGIVHGNINLNSLLIVQNDLQYFVIYFCDLAIWERLFEPATFAQPLTPNPQQDLEELGRVAFYLWVGKSVDPASNQPLDPRNEQLWPKSSPDLKQFIYRLMGIETPFESAETARLALLQFPLENQITSFTKVAPEEEKEKRFRTPLILVILLGIITLLSLGGIIWYFLGRGRVQEEDFAEFNQLVPSFTDVNGVPSGVFTYTGETEGTWSVVLKVRPTSELTFAQLLNTPKPDANAQFNYQPVPSPNIQMKSEPIEEVKKGQAQFAMTSLVENLSNDLAEKQIAYDGLLVFVAFSKKDANLPKVLNGQITLDQLRQIYTGQITNWQQLGGPNLPMKPFAPTEPEAVREFEKIVLQDDPQKIAQYKAIATTQATELTQQQIITAFDTGQAGIISYGILSKTWNQCAGYPLALVNGDKPPSQALFRLNGQPITPSDNICDKDNRLDIKTFTTGSYPLSYPLAVVYPHNNSLPPAGAKFAEILTTRQGQCLINKVGLVPLQPVPDKYLNSYDCK
ncbi:putative serine/threonine kinase (plasmid) [Scytonema sp. HK-05]|uniref:substrate-binding domain-containing protein n=1 Tax=Scytonema sp. HK-05 TaxID=1137095 RepID=UPI000935BE3F|nr:substrate-binding domain-containing protein [Scytonema sp. HK-05]OKH54467.1 serine/threonine protein kinase [Scytonema sp. HK-05]BAY49982.1 putative serine/threonine kinase [Scytonema sp. HK-05]